MLLDAFKGDRGLIYDADGVEVADVLRCDTETGEVTRYLRDETGSFYLSPDKLEEAATVSEVYPAPLRFVPHDECPEPVIVAATQG